MLGAVVDCHGDERFGSANRLKRCHAGGKARRDRRGEGKPVPWVFRDFTRRVRRTSIAVPSKTTSTASCPRPGAALDPTQRTPHRAGVVRLPSSEQGSRYDAGSASAQADSASRLCASQQASQDGNTRVFASSTSPLFATITGSTTRFGSASRPQQSATNSPPLPWRGIRSSVRQCDVIGNAGDLRPR